VTRVFNSHHETFQLVGAAAGTVTVVCTGYIGRRIGGPAVGLLAAGLAAVSASLIAVDGSMMSETIAIPLLTAAVWLALVAIERGAWWRFALLGAVLGLATLARADALITGTLVIAATALAVPMDGRRRFTLAAAAFAALALVVSPWAIRNEVEVGTPAIATISTAQTITGANCGSTYGGRLLGYWDPACLDENSRGDLDELAWNSHQTRRGLHYARTHASRVPLVVVARELRVLGLFHPLAQARLDAIETRSHNWQVFAWAMDLVTMVLGAVGLVRVARSQRRAALPLFAVVMSVFVTVALSYGNQRFRVTCEPVLLVGTAVAVVGLTRRPRAPLAA
jgi:asparagine N-glycosylation enzyme membrane subunit Stt3